MSEMITDIGIDLGTATVIIYVKGKGIVLKEPSVVAYDTRSGKVLCVGREAYTMIGRTPDRIRAVKPLDQGVISDNELCEKMLQHFFEKSLSERAAKATGGTVRPFPPSRMWNPARWWTQR